MFSFLPLFSQATEEITEGKEYWLGLPFCGREVNEAIRGDNPIEIWISSKVKCVATVSDGETGSVQNVTIYPNKITVVKYGDNLMNKESEVAHNYGIHVVADAPISVAVYMSYMWSGEAYRCTPVEWLGRKYVTLNMYQDQLTQAGEIRPPQILIIATDDNTKLNYRPTTETVSGVKAGAIGSVNLMKGQTFLIFGSYKENQSQQDVTDLSGTYLEANKPFAVISGHTKAAFPRYQYTFLGRNGGFMRNMMTDAMWPIELLGSDYVSAPVKYQDRVRGQIQDDLGDLIRFVPAYDNTIISQMRKDGTGMMKISPVLKRGQWYDIVNQEQAAFYSATNATTGKKVPVLVGQYGKTWWIHAVTPGTKQGDDQGQNPSRNGQGMLITLAPQDHWTSYATWRSPPSIDDFVYVTFRADEAKYLKYDGSTFQNSFGNAVKFIDGTPYAYITESVSSGDHFLQGDTIPGANRKATFGAYAYGNWDRSKDGFAYGYPIGINYNSPCEDTLMVKDTLICGNVTGSATDSALTPENVDCTAIFAVLLNTNTVRNYDFEVDPNFKPGIDKKVKWTLKVINVKDSAFAEIRVMTKSGKTVVRTYIYYPEVIKYEPLVVDFGLLKEGDIVCGKSIKITNNGKVPMTVNNLKLKNGRPEFELKIDSTAFPFTLQPGESRTIEVCAHALAMTKEMVYDYVFATLSCYDTTITQLKYVMGNPVVYIGDAHWDAQPVGSLTSKQVQIKNTSDVQVVLNTIDWPAADKTVFPKVDGLTFPIVLDARAQMEFTTWYNPDKIGSDSTRALFTGNTDKDKLYSDWTGSAITSGPQIFGFDWQKKRIVDGKWVSLPYPGEVIIGTTPDATAPLNVTKVYIKDDPDGVFALVGTYPAQLSAKETYKIAATFNPKAEKDYIATVVFESEFNNKPAIREAQLKGTGIQPHIAITGKEFKPAIKVNTSMSDFASITQPNPNPGYGMEVTITKLNITGPDADAFKIDDSYLNPSPAEVLQTDQNWPIPVIFTAKHQGKHIATITPENDAPDLVSADLIGYGYLEGVKTMGYDFQTIFKTTTKSETGQVYLYNDGTDPITITRDIRLSLSGDNTAFDNTAYPMTWRTSISLLTNPGVGFQLLPGETLFVDATFLALDVKTFNGQIEYQFYNNADTNKATQVAYSDLKGTGKILKTVIRIPKYPNDFASLYPSGISPGINVKIDYMVDQDKSETQPLETADILNFKAIVYFKSVGAQKVQYVFPKTSGPNGTMLPADIITAGTMTENWIIDAVEITNLGKDNQALEVTMHSDKPLTRTGNGILFSFDMNTFLSDTSMIPLPCDLQIIGIPKYYVVITDKIPGSIEINPACQNNLRLVILSGIQYSLMQNEPNPVTTKTSIKYSVGLEAQTTISLYNNNGEKVATLINQNLKPGEYELTVNVNELGLPSGTYFYKIESGPYIDSKGMTITK